MSRTVLCRDCNEEIVGRGYVGRCSDCHHDRLLDERISIRLRADRAAATDTTGDEL